MEKPCCTKPGMFSRIKEIGKHYLRDDNTFSSCQQKGNSLSMPFYEKNNNQTTMTPSENEYLYCYKELNWNNPECLKFLEKNNHKTT